MSLRAAVKAVMPAMLRHEGVWEGEYLRLNAHGGVEDRHASRVACVFPDEGDFAYVQHNHFVWGDGRVLEANLPARLVNGRLYWDVPTFHGSAWQSEEDVILLRLFRRDMPNAEFTEMITLAPGGRTRARTWHWFQDGALVGRTLCHEARIG